MKTCFKCNETKRFDEFYRHPRMADGRLNKCKDCTKSDVRRNRVANIDHYREYDARRAGDPVRQEAARNYYRTLRTESPERIAAYHAATRERYPQHYKARTAVSNAVRDGRLERQPCEVCGDAKSEAHHTDYSKPLDVRWLCRTHHRMAHGQLQHLA